ncbi:hypothetical protein NM208_g9529 [Fusarium decemcellulare]|uniref:Uncharacterized protein n=1 Tax=Fusarium decemcellulare TaxID=57161 RepID=A0ACC1S1I0_9HYPO|nr:hypothetical protein NM208_g9529 [Fusarium decemcellulare]
MNWSLVLSGLVFMTKSAIAWQYISPDALPSDSLSNSCKAALVVNLDCPRQVASFFEREPVPVASLEEACTSACRTSLANFETSLKTECGEEDVIEYDPGADPVHISIVATDIYYHLVRTCIKDGDRWCNAWAFENSPDRVSSTSGSTASTVTASVDMCDNCVIKPFQFLAGTSYSNGYALQADYSTLTESCSKTGFPLATTSISKANDVATAWMLYDNSLKAFCASFPSEGEKICIMNKCKTYTIQADDTCQGIAVAANISMVQLYTCDTICLEPHDDEDYAPITRTTTTLMPKPTAAPVPSNIANGTNENCAQFYSVQIGDYCNQIIMAFSISLQDFLFLNQGINAECTNLFAEESYCVAPVGPINMYPGHPDYVDPVTVTPDVAFSDLPNATFTAPVMTGLPTYLPRANGTRKDCLIYIDGTDLQVDMSWSFSFSACAELAGTWEMSLDELQNWNPSLNATSPDCAFSEDFSYCMAAYKKLNTYTGEDESESAATSTTTASTASTDTTAEPTETELPIRDGAAEGCTKYYAVVPPQTCQEVLDANNLTIAEFYAMNPSIGAECTNLWPNYRYCVEVKRMAVAVQYGKTLQRDAQYASDHFSSNCLVPRPIRRICVKAQFKELLAALYHLLGLLCARRASLWFRRHMPWGIQTTLLDDVMGVLGVANARLQDGMIPSKIPGTCSPDKNPWMLDLTKNMIATRGIQVQFLRPLCTPAVIQVTVHLKDIEDDGSSFLVCGAIKDGKGKKYAKAETRWVVFRPRGKF